MLEYFIVLAGLLHFTLLIASALTPRVLAWRTELQKLSGLSQQVIWTHGAFLVLIIIGFGLLSVLLPGELAAGTRLARVVCGFMAIFWLARLVLQFIWFDARAYLTRWWLKAGYAAITVVFLALGCIYGAAAVLPPGAL